MTTPRIEQANTKGRFTIEEIRGFIRKQNAAPKKPETRKATTTSKGIKFPDLAKRSGTAPAAGKEHPSVTNARLRLNLSK